MAIKQNDWIVAGITNPNTDVGNFILSGVNAENTQLLPADEYKKSNFIKDKFSSNGVFNEAAFDEFYKKRVEDFGRLQALSSVDIFQYDPFDTRAGASSMIKSPEFAFKQEANPTKDITVLTGDIYKNNLSQRELAQQNKIWDSARGEWSEDTANDRSLVNSPLKWIKTFLGEPLVYATYDSDGDHYDQYTGQTVKHKKGEYKLNQYGSPYTETLNGRSLVGKEVVSALDVITVDKEGVDKYNFFDSDDLDKSPIGTIASSVAAIAPMLMGPYVSAVYSGILVARELSKSLPMLYGLTTAWFDLPSENSTLNNIAARATALTGSTSDYGKSSVLNFEVLNKLITDVATQWGQQKVIAQSIGKLRGSKNLMEEAYKKAKLQYDLQRAAIEEKVSQEIITREALEKYAGSSDKWMESVLGKASIQSYVKEVEPIVQRYTKLGQDTSLAYMALVSNTDVYSSMLEAGATKKEAAAVALGSTLGMFSVDKYLHLGELFFDDATAAYENQIRRTFKKEATSWYNNVIKSRADEVATSPKANKLKNILQSSIEYGRKNTNKFIEDLKYHTTGFAGKAIGEGIEEVSEELVTDLSKQIYELAGDLGFDTATKDVGAWDNWQARYGMSFLGGTLGGGLFYGVDLYQNGKFQVDKTQDELIYLVRNGKTKEALKTLDEWRDKGKLGSTSLSIETAIDKSGKKVFLSADDNRESQNDFVYKRIKESILQLEGIINENQAKLSDDDLFQNMILSESRFRELQKFFNLQDYSYITSYQRDYQNTLNNIANIEEALKRANKTDTGLNYESDEEFKAHFISDEKLRNLSDIERNARNANLKRIQEDLKLAKDELQKFLSGEYSLDYTEKLLFALDDRLNSEFVSLTFDKWLKKNHSGKTPESLSPAERQRYKEEYLNYRRVAQAQDLDQKYTIYKTIKEQVNPILLGIQQNQEGFRYFKDQISQLWDVEIPKQYQFDDVLDFLGETEESESFINRKEPQNREKRENYILYHNNQQLTEFKNKILSIIDQAGGYIDPISRRTLKLWLRNRTKDRLDSLRYNLSLDMQRSNPDHILTDLDSNILLLLEGIDISNIDKSDLIWSQIEQLVKDYYSEPIIKSNAQLGSILNYLVDAGLYDPEEFGGLYGGILKEQLQEKVQKQLDLGKSLDEIFNIDNSEIFPQNYEEYGVSQQQLAAFLTNIRKEYENNTLDDYAWEEQNLDAVEDEKEYKETISYYGNLFNQYLDNVKSDAIIGLNQELDNRVKNINPVTDLVEQLALHLNVNMQNIEKILQDLDTRFEQSDYIEDIVLDSKEKESFEEAAYIIKLAQAYISAAASVPNIVNEFGHNSTLNEFASNHRDIYKNFQELPVLSQDIAAMYISELDKYLLQMGIKDEQTGQYNPGSWQWLSAQNEINKAQQFIRADRAWSKTCYDLFSFGYNSGSFKFSYEGVDYDLLEGFETIQQVNENTKDSLVHLNKLFNLYYNNIQKLVKKGWTYKQILERSGLLEKMTSIEEIPQQKTCSLDQNITFDRMTSYDKMVFLTTIAAMDSTKFYSYLKSRIDEEDGIAPLTIQEWVSRVGISYIENPEIFNQTLEYVKEKTGDKRPIVYGVYIAGNAGAGKTRVVARNEVKYIKEDNIWLSAPKRSQINTLFDSVTKGIKMLNREEIDFGEGPVPSLFTRMGVDKKALKEALDLIKDPDFQSEVFQHKASTSYFSIEDIGSSFIIHIDFSKFGIKKIENAPKAIVIDEATHLSNLELQLISEFCRLNNTKLILVGDSKQKGFFGVGHNIDREQCLTIRTPNLGISLRDNNAQHQFNLKTLESLIDQLSSLEVSDPEYKNKVNSIKALLKTIRFKVYNQDDIHGEQLTSELTEETAKKMKGTVGYVGSQPSSTLDTLRKAGLEPTVLNELDIQGQEFDYIVIGKDFPKINQNSTDLEILDFLQDLYTMISRGRKGSIIIDHNKSLESIIGQNRVEFAKAEAQKISEYAEGFRKEKIALLDKVLSQKEEAPVSNTNPDQKTISIVADKDFDIDSLDPNSQYVLYQTSSDQVDSIVNNGLKLENLQEQLVFATKDTLSQAIQLQRDGESQLDTIVLVKLDKETFGDVKTLEDLSKKLVSLGNDSNYIPAQYIDKIIKTTRDDIPEEVKTDPSDAADIPQPSEEEQQELAIEGLPEDPEDVEDPGYQNPILCYGKATFTGLQVKQVDGKEVWINPETGKRDMQIFTSKQEISDTQEQIDLSNKIRELKNSILYRKGYQSLPSYITSLISEDEYNNIQWFIEAREQNDQDNFIRNLGLSREKMTISSKNLVYSIIGEVKLKDGSTATITLGLLSNPESWISAIPSIKKRLRNKIEKQKGLLTTLGLTKQQKDLIQSKIDHYEQQYKDLNLDDSKSAPNKYKAYIEDIAEQYDGKAPVRIKVPKLIAPGLTDLHKQDKVVRLSRKSKALIENAESRIASLQSALGKVRGDTLKKLKIQQEIARAKKKLEEFREIRDSSLRSLNPYTVMSPMYVYTPSTAIRSSSDIDDSVIGRCNVIFVSNDTSLDSEKLVDIYIQQKNQLNQLRKQNGSVDFKDLQMVPSVRMVVLSNMGVSFQDLSNPYLAESMRNFDPKSEDELEHKNIFPFKTNFMGVRMYVGLWNFRANLLQFKNKFDKFVETLPIPREALDEYLMTKDLIWRRDHERKLTSQEKLWLSSHQNLDKQEEVFSLVDKFNDSLGDQVKEFRLGSDLENGAYIRRLSGNTQALYNTEDKVNGIYINSSTLDKYLGIANSLFENVLDHIVQCDYEHDRLLSVKESVKNSFANHITSLANSNGQIEVIDAYSGEVQTINFGSSFDPEKSKGILNTFSHIPAVLSKVFKYTSIRQRHLNGDNFDTSSKYSIRVKGTVEINGEKVEINDPIPYWRLWRHVNMIESASEYDVDLINGYVFDPSLSNFFSFAFHGTLEDISDTNAQRASDALFPRGFYADPMSTAETVLNKGQKMFTKVEQQQIFFGADVSIGDPTFFVSLQDIESGIHEAKEDKQDIEILKECTQIINTALTSYPQLKEELETILQDLTGVPDPQKIDYTQSQVSDVLRRYTTNNFNAIFSGRYKTIDINSLVLQDSDTTALTLTQVISQEYKKLFGEELGEIQDISVDGTTLIVDTQNVQLKVSRGLDNQINVSKIAQSLVDDSKVVSLVEELIETMRSNSIKVDIINSIEGALDIYKQVEDKAAQKQVIISKLKKANTNLGGKREIFQMIRKIINNISEPNCI